MDIVQYCTFIIFAYKIWHFFAIKFLGVFLYEGGNACTKFAWIWLLSHVQFKGKIRMNKFSLHLPFIRALGVYFLNILNILLSIFLSIFIFYSALKKSAREWKLRSQGGFTVITKENSCLLSWGRSLLCFHSI